MARGPFHRFALVNPAWDFEGSSYWACTEPHLPLELLYSSALLERSGFPCRVVDAHLEGLSHQETAARIAEFEPHLIVLTTAPTYLFWRCPQPELDVPRALGGVLRSIAPLVAVGPHGSATPGYVLEALGCAAVIRGEPEEELLRIARGQPSPATWWAGAIPGAASDRVAVVDLAQLPSLEYGDYPLEKRTHRHHVFLGEGRGAEAEFSRGCPYACGFCNRRFFRSGYRERPVDRVLSELRRLRDRGVGYVYFIDEVFGLGRCQGLLRALADEQLVEFGCQTRIDLWDRARLDLLADAGCVSIEFGVESPLPEQQQSINKGYRIEGERILELMVHAKSRIPWVQGDLIDVPNGSDESRRRTAEWRNRAIASGVWVSEPVKPFPYPGSDLFESMLGPVDDDAWDRARRVMSEG